MMTLLFLFSYMLNSMVIT